MANINVVLEDVIYVPAEEWFDEADTSDIKEMESLILEERFGKLTVQQQVLYNKLMELMDKYYTLPQSTIDTIMKL